MHDLLFHRAITDLSLFSRHWSYPTTLIFFFSQDHREKCSLIGFHLTNQRTEIDSSDRSYFLYRPTMKHLLFVPIDFNLQNQNLRLSPWIKIFYRVFRHAYFSYCFIAIGTEHFSCKIHRFINGNILHDGFVLIQAQTQDIGEITSNVFNNLLSSVVSRWGNMSSTDMAEFIKKFNEPGLQNIFWLKNSSNIDIFLGGLNHIWNALDSHCNSHFDCGPDACCLQPSIKGKRGFTDGCMYCLIYYEDFLCWLPFSCLVNLHMSSYCSPLKKAGQTCSLYHSGETTSTFSCPCSDGLTCVSGGSVPYHPLITIQKNSICKWIEKKDTRFQKEINWKLIEEKRNQSVKIDIKIFFVPIRHYSLWSAIKWYEFFDYYLTCVDGSTTN